MFLQIDTSEDVLNIHTYLQVGWKISRDLPMNRPVNHGKEFRACQVVVGSPASGSGRAVPPTRYISNPPSCESLTGMK